MLQDSSPSMPARARPRQMLPRSSQRRMSTSQRTSGSRSTNRTISITVRDTTAGPAHPTRSPLCSHLLRHMPPEACDCMVDMTACRLCLQTRRRR